MPLEWNCSLAFNDDKIAEATRREQPGQFRAPPVGLRLARAKIALAEVGATGPTAGTMTARGFPAQDNGIARREIVHTGADALYLANTFMPKDDRCDLSLIDRV